LSEIKKGIKFTEEHKKNLSLNHRKTSSDEAKQHMSEAWTKEKKQKQRERYQKPVICIETGIQYKSKNDAAINMNLSVNSIYHNLHGRNKNVRGYSFKFKEV
jgi:hypothetical protein